MIWFWVVVLVVVIGAAALIAAGRGDAMADVYEDRPDMALERGRRLTAADVRAVRFTTAVRGYRMDEVDAFVARMEAELLAISHPEDRINPGQPAGEPSDAGYADADANVMGDALADDDEDRPPDSSGLSQHQPSHAAYADKDTAPPTTAGDTATTDPNGTEPTGSR
ncbi:MAG: DivIVA domain-containing protein [Nocardioidaceae bacterium]|nr:DivIVA domain-containing protein [Nocardioidaceae bacterium]